MAGPNCKANTTINHQYWLRRLALNDVPPAPTVPLAAGPNPFDIRFTAEQFGLSRKTQTVSDQGTGTPWEIKGSEIETQYAVNGAVRMTPRPEQMGDILECLFGNKEITANKPPTSPATGKTYGPSGVICDFFHMAHYDPTDALKKVFHYHNLVTNTWTLSSSEQSPLLSLEWNIEGSLRLTDDYDVLNYTALPLSVTQPWVHRGAVVTIGGRNFRVRNVAIAGNNNLATDGYFNSAYRDELPTQFQTFTLSHETPFDLIDDFNLLNTAANVAATVVYTSGARVLTIGFPNLIAWPDDPAIQGRSRVLYQVNWKAQYDPNVVDEKPIYINVL